MTNTHFKKSNFYKNFRSGFTLLELIMVVGIVAILGTVSVVVLNPAQQFKQSRDVGRISDMQSINNALLYYQAVGGSAFGDHHVIYVSLPDISPTCANLALPTPPTGWSYSCQTAANYRNVNGTGWIPVDFTTAQGTAGVLFSSLPVDPVNTVLGDYYYTYIFGTWTVSATLESTKYLASSSANDGGCVASRFEAGNDLTLNCNITTGGGSTSAGITGYVWSSNIGWISLNCTNSATCGTANYGLTADYTTGIISGYAWSANVGWISFNVADLTGCPSGICEARVSGGLTGVFPKTVTGWAKILSSTDGWMHLTGTALDVTAYGVSLASDKTLSGYSWDSTFAGWTHWRGVALDSTAYGGQINW